MFDVSCFADVMAHVLASVGCVPAAGPWDMSFRLEPAHNKVWQCE